jgi:hypothetical protein
MLTTDVHTHPAAFTDFLEAHGRVPRIGDAAPPWRYRGWLLHYVMLAHELCPDVPDRWGYLLSILEAGELPAAPIPQLQFDHPNAEVLRSLERIVERIAVRYGAWTGLGLLVRFLNHGLATGLEGDGYPTELAEADAEELYRTFDALPLLRHPADYLGTIVSTWRGTGSWNPTAFYPTPHPVVEAMVQMQMADAGDARRLSVCDPCLGTGRMLLHASNHSLFLFGQDIDAFVLRIALFNGAMYAPWMVRPLPSGLMKHPVPMALSPEAPALQLTLL